MTQTVTAILAKIKRQTGTRMIHELTDELWEKSSAMLAKNRYQRWVRPILDAILTENSFSQSKNLLAMQSSIRYKCEEYCQPPRKSKPTELIVCETQKLIMCSSDCVPAFKCIA